MDMVIIRSHPQAPRLRLSVNVLILPVPQAAADRLVTVTVITVCMTREARLKKVILSLKKDAREKQNIMPI